MRTKIYSFLTKHWLLSVLAFFVITAGTYGICKPLPAGLNMRSSTYNIPDASITFLSDETYVTANGDRHMDQHIFDEVFKMIEGAKKYIVVDMFLWNSFQGQDPETHRKLSDEITKLLIDTKRKKPDISITVISDPINTVYDGQRSSHFDALRAEGISIILTEHSSLRDSNPVYSAFWRGILQWFDHAHTVLVGKPYTFRLLPNIMQSGGEHVPLRSYLKLFNFKANHRKLIVADNGNTLSPKMITLVTSANPHDGSSAHSNVALRIEDGVWRDALASERSVVTFSDGKLTEYPRANQIEDAHGDISVTLLTERAILDATLTMIEKANSGDRIDLAMFYLSERRIIDALIDAGNRDVSVRVILDPNKDAFGIKKNGVPNRSVAAKLINDTEGKIAVRWCDTHGEQCHSKMLLVATPHSYALMLGSANFTRRNLYNLNLETDIQLESKEPSTAYKDAESYFERMWNNEAGRMYTVDYAVYKDETRFHRILAWLMERTGLSTF